jgi:hypothetical protein
MPRYNPYTIQMQVSRMFDQGQALFATMKVQDWLRERNEDPNAYNVLFHEHPAPPGSDLVKMVTIELQRKDGQPVDAWLQQEVNRHA